MAIAKLLCPTSLKNMHHIFEDSFIPEMYSLQESFNSQWLSMRHRLRRNLNRFSVF
jgi:hypothetical protein